MAVRNQAFPIVGVGASAGGVEALEGFFKGLPAEPELSVVVVTHLAPDRESFLPDIIARYAPIPVEPIRDGAEVAPNRAYVLAASAVVGMKGGRLTLNDQTAMRERKPIDVFLSSLAKDQGECAAAVILSGGDGDGTLGAKAVKERGGLTLAQIADGHGPAHPDMPESAIATGFIDFALPVDQMGARLVEFASAVKGRRRNVADGVDLESPPAELRDEICAILRNQVGHDFAGYKEKTFLRRIERRIHVTQAGTLDGYVEKLRQSPEEVNALFRDLLINVTNFFRDAEAFDKLKEVVVPKLFEGRGASDVVRIWVPGCATGEEVFSIAILMREHMDTLSAVPRVQIFATDINENALNVARAARYPEALLDSVSAERRKRFFIPDGGGFMIARDVRDLCIFSPHSVLRDPPFSRLDFVSCRNLLIYFGPAAQSQVIPIFHYSLRKGGYLFLGASENVSQFADLFAPLDKKHRIFRAREDGARPFPPSLATPIARAAAAREARGGVQPASPAVRQLAENQIIDRHAPPHVVVDRDGEVVYFSARTGKYLEAAAGPPTRQLFSMARRRLRLDLRAVFRQAVETGRVAVKEGIAVDDEHGNTQFLTVTVEPLADRERERDEPLFVILFDDSGPLLAPGAERQDQHDPQGARLQLEAELRETRERLQSTIEEYETALEELRATNEELVSVNEEAQSSNEEMQASKEELQSLNEELNTVNAELNSKIEALDAANADLVNLFGSTQIATVFLDSELRIRMYTPAAAKFFNLLPADRERRLTDLAAAFVLPSLAADIRGVIASGQTLERQVVLPAKDVAKSHFLVRFSPYRAADGKIEGAVISFIDVTSLTEAENRQQVLIDELNHRVKNMLMVIIGLAQQTYRTTNAQSFLPAFVDRLHAMARGFNVLSREKWDGASLADVVKIALAPFGEQVEPPEGPPVRLRSRQALALVMVLHELATNAVKYGALSRPEGRVTVDWSQSKGMATFRWREQDGPPVKIPGAMNFGGTLVKNEISSNLDGACDFDFAPDGLKVEITFPARNGNRE